MIYKIFLIVVGFIWIAIGPFKNITQNYFDLSKINTDQISQSLFMFVMLAGVIAASRKRGKSNKLTQEQRNEFSNIPHVKNCERFRILSP